MKIALASATRIHHISMILVISAIAALVVMNARCAQASEPARLNSVSEARPTAEFKTIAYHVDLRVQVMPIAALKALAKEISSLGFNALIME